MRTLLKMRRGDTAYTPILASGVDIPLLFRHAVLEGEQLLWQDAAADTTPTEITDPIGGVRSAADGEVIASQATSADRPVWDGTGAVFNQVNQTLALAFDAEWSGTMVVGTTRGSYALDVVIPSGTYSFGRWERWSVVGVLFYEGGLSAEDKARAERRLVQLGAKRAFDDVSDFTSAWRARADIVGAFPWIDTRSGVTFVDTWRMCQNVEAFPLIDTSKATALTNAWRDCAALPSFPELDTGAAESVSGAWFGCTLLASFPAIDTSEVLNFSNGWRLCPALTSFPELDTAKGTNFSGAWLGCTGLTSFPELDTGEATTLFEAWRQCSGLTSFPAISTPKVTNFGGAWRLCTGLTSFPAISTVAGTNFSNTWLGCSALTTFPAGVFDACPATNYENAFNLCALNQTSVDNILVSVATAADALDRNNGTLGISGGTNSPPGAAGNTARDALIARGWTVAVNS
jgi:hypothetical protein